MKQLGIGVLGVVGAALVFSALRYFIVGPDSYFPDQLETYLAYQVPLLAHIAGALAALVTLPVQLSTRIRASWPQVHRWSGRLYVFGVLIGGLGGLVMAFHAFGCWVSQVGFLLLAGFWLSTTAAGWRAARRRDLVAHRKWMTMSASLTLGAIMLRIYLPVAAGLMAMGAPFEFVDAYRVVAWLSWVPNLALAWWWTWVPTPRRTSVVGERLSA
jgi:uncharacterized membrane protein